MKKPVCGACFRFLTMPFVKKLWTRHQDGSGREPKWGGGGALSIPQRSINTLKALKPKSTTIASSRCSFTDPPEGGAVWREQTQALTLKPQNQPGAYRPLVRCGYSGAAQPPSAFLSLHDQRALPAETETTAVWNETFSRTSKAAEALPNWLRRFEKRARSETRDWLGIFKAFPNRHLGGWSPAPLTQLRSNGCRRLDRLSHSGVAGA